MWLHRTILNDGGGATEPPATDHLRHIAHPSNGTHAYAVSTGGAAKLMEMHEIYRRTPRLCMVAADPALGSVPVSSTSTTEED